MSKAEKQRERETAVAAIKAAKAAKAAEKAAILGKHKPKDGKELTDKQRLARLEEFVGITGK